MTWNWNVFFGMLLGLLNFIFKILIRVILMGNQNLRQIVELEELKVAHSEADVGRRRWDHQLVVAGLELVVVQPGDRILNQLFIR
jgi:hypothetical protein